MSLCVFVCLYMYSQEVIRCICYAVYTSTHTIDDRYTYIRAMRNTTSQWTQYAHRWIYTHWHNYTYTSIKIAFVPILQLTWTWTNLLGVVVFFSTFISSSVVLSFHLVLFLFATILSIHTIYSIVYSYSYLYRFISFCAKVRNAARHITKGNIHYYYDCYGYYLNVWMHTYAIVNVWRFVHL